MQQKLSILKSRFYDLKSDKTMISYSYSLSSDLSYFGLPFIQPWLLMTSFNWFGKSILYVCKCHPYSMYFGNCRFTNINHVLVTTIKRYESIRKRNIQQLDIIIENNQRLILCVENTSIWMLLAVRFSSNFWYCSTVQVFKRVNIQCISLNRQIQLHLWISSVLVKTSWNILYLLIVWKLFVFNV